MRFHINDTRLHRRLAKALARALSRAGVGIGHSAASDLAARLYGYADRRELDACAGRGPASAWDEDEAPGVAASRRERQAQALVAAGVPAGKVGEILDEVRPTSRARTSAKSVPAQAGRPERGTDGLRPGMSSASAGGVPGKDRGMQANGFGIDALLDGWESVSGLDHEGLFGTMVLRAYRQGYSKLSLREAWGQGYAIVAVGASTETVLHKGSAKQGQIVRDWVYARRDDVIRVPMDGEDIRVVVTGASHDSDIDCTLLDALSPPPPLCEYGIPNHREWLDAVLTRPGFHILCSDFGFGRLDETLASEFRRRGLRRTCNAPFGPVNSAQVVTGDKGHGAVAALETGIGRAVVILVSAKGSEFSTPESYMRELLTNGLDPAFLRGALVSAGTRMDRPPLNPSLIRPDSGCELGMDGMCWEVEIRQACARPDAPGLQAAWDMLKAGYIEADDYKEARASLRRGA